MALVKKRRGGCIESPDGRHHRDNTQWWCSWCSAELGMPKSRATKADAVDATVAATRLAGIKDDPSNLVAGAPLESRLDELSR